VRSVKWGMIVLSYDSWENIVGNTEAGE